MRKTEIPEVVYLKLEKSKVDDNGFRSCNVFIEERNAIVYIDPESFDFSEVYEADPGLDLCRDDCSGFYMGKGEIARQALNQYRKTTLLVTNKTGKK